MLPLLVDQRIKTYAKYLITGKSQALDSANFCVCLCVGGWGGGEGVEGVGGKKHIL